jgi:hypothetical protein
MGMPSRCHAQCHPIWIKFRNRCLLITLKEAFSDPTRESVGKPTLPEWPKNPRPINRNGDPILGWPANLISDRQRGWVGPTSVGRVSLNRSLPRRVCHISRRGIFFQPAKALVAQPERPKPAHTNRRRMVKNRAASASILKETMAECSTQLELAVC